MNNLIVNRKLIELKNLFKAYETEAGPFMVLKDIDLTIGKGEFVGVVGKSGSGKSTLINMITGIDRPTRGEIFVAGNGIHALNEGEMAVWRGKNLGIVFQFFQLLPTLTVAENVMLPMDFAELYSVIDRKKRAAQLLDLVEIGEQADKLPSQLSGGQQQRAAIARALSCDPPIIVADEPTGNLDSKTADRIFDLFEQLVDQGKTIVMVTHDSDIAKRLGRTLIIADGEIIEEYLEKTFPGFDEKTLIEITEKVTNRIYQPGEVIVKKNQKITHLYIVVRGQVDIILSPPDAYEFVVASYKRGQHFGEIEMVTGKLSVAKAIVGGREPAEIAEIDFATFNKLLAKSPAGRKRIEDLAKIRLEENIRKSHKRFKIQDL